jgi:hypothetical protein
LQCCLVTDGGGALILVSAERARDFPQKPVYLHRPLKTNGGGLSYMHSGMYGMYA